MDDYTDPEKHDERRELGAARHASGNDPTQSPFGAPPALRSPHLAEQATLDREARDPAIERTEPDVVDIAPALAGAANQGGRDWKLPLALLVASALLLVAGWFAYAAHANEQTATDWQQRALELEEQVSGLRTLIGERSAQLNERTRQANGLAGNLRSTRVALRRSEGDVSSLARRQRELANEKAQLEDQRRALQRQAADLEDIASRYIDCKDSLVDVIESLVYRDYRSASYEIDVAQSRCDSAAAALNAFVAAYS